MVLDCSLSFFQEIIAEDATHDSYLNEVNHDVMEVINEVFEDALHYFILYLTSPLTFIHASFMSVNAIFIIVFIIIFNYFKFV
jgi:hypothetical protein